MRGYLGLIWSEMYLNVVIIWFLPCLSLIMFNPHISISCSYMLQVLLSWFLRVRVRAGFGPQAWHKHDHTCSFTKYQQKCGISIINKWPGYESCQAKKWSGVLAECESKMFCVSGGNYPFLFFRRVDPVQFWLWCGWILKWPSLSCGSPIVVDKML